MSDLLKLVLDSILEKIPANVYWKDTSGKFIGSNNAQAELFGMKSADSLIGKKDSQLIGPKDSQAVQLTDQEVMQEKNPVCIEEKICIAGDEKTFISHKVPLLDNQNTLLGILGISFDITARVRQEEFSNNLLKVLLDNIPAHIYWKDINGQYLGCNLTQAKAMGFSIPEQIIGKTDFDLSDIVDPSEIEKNDSLVIKNKKPISYEESAFVGNKEVFFLSTKIPLMDSKGNVTGLLGISTDITDKKRAEALQKELEFQQRANTMLKLWSSAIAHEMRTPLTALSMNVSTLGTLILSLQNSVPEIKNSHRAMKKIDRLNEIPPKLEKTIDAANHFIDMTLMKSRAGDEEIEMNLVPLSMADEIKAAIQSYPFRDGDEQFVNIDTKLDFKFMGESNFFHHVIFNLLKNALHYVKQADKGSILITTVPGKTENILIFKDTGPGMSQENVDQLFKPFFSKTKHGTGVGLSLCHNLMGAFGGSISCTSVEGEFTEFKLMFPVVISDGS